MLEFSSYDEFKQAVRELIKDELEIIVDKSADWSEVKVYLNGELVSQDYLQENNMFGLFDDLVDSVLTPVGKLLDGEDITKRDIIRLVDTGLTVYAIAEMTGIAVDVIEKVLEE